MFKKPRERQIDYYKSTHMISTEGARKKLTINALKRATEEATTIEDLKEVIINLIEEIER